MTEQILLVKLADLGNVIQAAYSAFELNQEGLSARLLTSSSYAGYFPEGSRFACLVPADYVNHTKLNTLEADNKCGQIVQAIKTPGDTCCWDRSLTWLDDLKNYNIAIDLDGFPGSILLAARLKNRMKTVGWRGRINTKGHPQRQVFEGVADFAYCQSFRFDDDLHGIERYRSLLQKAAVLPVRAFCRPAKLFDYPPCSRQGTIGRKIALHLVTSIEGKDWPVQNFSELLVQLHKTLKVPFDEVVLLGNATDPRECKAAADFTTEVTGQCELPVCDLLKDGAEYALQAAALGVCIFFIGGDSSWGHMAAALGIRTFTIFGEDRRPKVYRPWPNAVDFEIEPQPGGAITEIGVDAVLKRIRPLLPKVLEP